MPTRVPAVKPNEPRIGRTGHPRYRGFVGPPLDYDLVAGRQFTLLFYAGLREDHLLLDLGCGSLRGGRLFIPYLKPERYYGVEPNEWLIEEGLTYELGHDIVKIKRPVFSSIADFSLGSLGVRFDFVLAQSIVSHTYDELTFSAFTGVRDCLAERGVLVGTFLESDAPREGTGWSYPDPVPYRWHEMEDLAERAGLAVRRVAWPHPRQTWFLGALERGWVGQVAEAVSGPHPPLRPPGR